MAIEAEAALLLTMRMAALLGRIENRLASLTQRERKVLDALVIGQSNKAIARELGTSPRTIEVHRARIMEKLAARNAADLIRIVMTASRTS